MPVEKETCTVLPKVHHKSDARSNNHLLVFPLLWIQNPSMVLSIFGSFDYYIYSKDPGAGEYLVCFIFFNLDIKPYE